MRHLTERINIRFDKLSMKQLKLYADDHCMTPAQVARLAVLKLLEKGWEKP